MEKVDWRRAITFSTEGQQRHLCLLPGEVLERARRRRSLGSLRATLELVNEETK